jgi:hypothetical protein
VIEIKRANKKVYRFIRISLILRFPPPPLASQKGG